MMLNHEREPRLCAAKTKKASIYQKIRKSTVHNRVSSRATDVLEPTLSNLPNSETFATLIGGKVYIAAVWGVRNRSTFFPIPVIDT